MSKTGKKIIAIHILPHTSRSKNNQTKKFGQLIKYNMGNICLEILYTKCGGEAGTRRFSKESKLSISLNQQYEILCSLFLLYVQVKNC